MTKEKLIELLKKYDFIYDEEDLVSSDDHWWLGNNKFKWKSFDSVYKRFVFYKFKHFCKKDVEILLINLERINKI